MSYFADTFNTFHKPEDSTPFCGVTFKELYKFLDYLFLAINLDAPKINYSFKTPKNLLLAFTDKEFRVFIGDDKAIAEMNLIAFRTHQQDKLPILSDANEIGIQQLGFVFDYYLDIDLISFKAAIPFVERNFSKSISAKLTGFGDVLKSQADPSANIPASTISFFNCWILASDQINKEFERKNAVMNINPRFKARGIVVNPSQCFYVMQFNDDGIQEAHDAIEKKLSEELGIDVIKSGDIFDPNRANDMVENIWQDIMQSKFIIADLSKKNPNVFYELGICDTVGKTVIPICSETSFNDDYHTHFPFDIQQEMAIIYKNGFTGISNLQAEVLKRATAITRGQAINVTK